MSPHNQYLFRDGFRIHPRVQPLGEVCRSGWIHAKREWTCVECRRKIKPREYYLNFDWVDNELWHTANYCSDCALLFGLRLLLELTTPPLRGA